LRKTRNAPAPSSQNRPIFKKWNAAAQAPFALAHAALAGDNRIMLYMPRLALAAAAAFLLGSAAAQNPPPGWTVEKSPALWVASSPDQGRGLRVKLVYKAAQQPDGALALWFPDAHKAAAREFGELIAAGRVDAVNQQGLPPMLASNITVKQPQGGRATVIAYGYDTAKGRQLALILLPSTLSQRTPAYRAAYASLEEYWRAHGVYQPTETPAASTPASSQ
jgi:hypothetical protein